MVLSKDLNLDVLITILLIVKFSTFLHKVQSIARASHFLQTCGIVCTNVARGRYPKILSSSSGGRIFIQHLSLVFSRMSGVLRLVSSLWMRFRKQSNLKRGQGSACRRSLDVVSDSLQTESLDADSADDVPFRLFGRTLRRSRRSSPLSELKDNLARFLRRLLDRL